MAPRGLPSVAYDWPLLLLSRASRSWRLPAAHFLYCEVTLRTPTSHICLGGVTWAGWIF
ncbi:uncharacterized protein CTRU02_215590 [Colletotrichum truncatum]|uniref:Uncharacterized protein n=1 Tax=Colletotrichum truncatum TaxID=5467 RepID=A0ACC3YC38_COLTU|nr:uncharacterized protein CTRU02_05478 [Colletotrichum truncatum]KAF6793921.1 hypothetical protein CTRU02_05478 [Colletotrichum truncatum]